MSVARLLAVPWIVGVVLTEEARFVPPWGRVPGLMLAAVLAAGALAIELVSRRETTSNTAVTAAVGGLVLDSVVACGFVWLYAGQPLSGIWAALYILPLEAATFFSLRGALITWGGVTVVYTGLQAAAVGAFGVVFSGNTIAFQMGIGLIVAIISGLQARSLSREREALETELEHRQNAERRLAERHRQLTEAREIARLGAWEWDRETDRLTWSEGLYEIHGLDPSTDADVASFIRVQHPDDRGRVRAALSRALRDRTGFALEYRIIRPDGEERYLKAKGEVVLDAFGEASGLFGTVQDITAQRAIQAALTHVNAELQRSVNELEQRNTQATLTASMGEMLLSCMTRDEINSVVADFGRRMFPKASGALGVVCGTLLECAATWPEHEPVAASDRDSCWALRRRKPHVAEGGNEAQRCGHLDGTDEASLCVPLIAQGELLGVLTIRDEAGAGWMVEGVDDANRRLAQTMAEYVGLALANLNLRDELREQSVRDPLTGLYNRRYLAEIFDRELQRSIRSGDPLSLLAVDIDRFKMLNDTCGHGAGDEALRSLGAFLISQIRAGDVACRVGGDEFVLLLTGAAGADAMARAEQIRAGCSGLVRADEWGMGVSIGVSVLGEDGSDVETLQRRADTALYRAKRSGRNRVARCEEPAPSGPLRLAVGG